MTDKTNKQKAVEAIEKYVSTGVSNDLYAYDTYDDWVYSNYYNDTAAIKDDLTAVVRDAGIPITDDGALEEWDGQIISYRDLIGAVRKLWLDETLALDRAKYRRHQERFTAFYSEARGFIRRLKMMRDFEINYDRMNGRENDMTKPAYEALIESIENTALRLFNKGHGHM